ncbi:MAG TPA: type II toxin-antitoxin system PemK/MazF family toxin [Polyangia bacterium]
MNVYRRGHLYWAWLDKRRPVLVISTDARNERANDVIVVPCSTTLREAPTHVRLGRGEGGLPRDSILKCEQIGTKPKRDVEPTPIGLPLRSTRMAEVERAVLRAIGIPVR